MIRVVLVDDHPIVRAGMQAILEDTSDIEVVGAGGTGNAALALVTDHHPDVLVLDLNLPDLDGNIVMERLRDAPNAPAVLILTMHSDAKTVFALLEQGATGYVLKDEAVESLPHAVRAVAHGKSWLSPDIAHKVVRRALDEPAPPTPPAEEGGVDPLTPREQEVLALLTQGLDNAAIAQRLTVTKRTVQNHVSAIYSKLGVDSRAKAILYAIRQGWVDIHAE